MGCLKMAALALLFALVAVTARAETTNVALDKEVKLNGSFFAGGWGDPFKANPQTLVDGIFLPQSNQWDYGTVWWDARDRVERSIEISLGAVYSIESFVVQADDNDAYKLYYRDPTTREWKLAWNIPNYDVYGGVNLWGIQTRPNPYDNSQRYLLLQPVVTDALLLNGDYTSSDLTGLSVSEIQAFGQLANKPPTVNAGPNVFLSSNQVSATVLEGMAHDADGDALTFRWLEGVNELSGATAVGPNGEAKLFLSDIAQLAIGTHILTLEVSDGKAVSTATFVLTIANSAPVAAVTSGATIEIGTPLSLSATAADFDGDMLSYRWLEGDIVLDSGAAAAVKGGLPVTIPAVHLSGLSLGDHEITLEISDALNPPALGKAMVTVIDTIAPTLRPIASAGILWPPNHELIDVVIAVNAKDNSGGTILLQASASSSEPPDADGDGSTIPDIIGPSIVQSTGVISFQLRAERAGKGAGKVYTILITATDEYGNTGKATVAIQAPHDRGTVK
ncbi:MAG: hypothetical protein HYS23_14235 [Geobacter sp.]|nr:hypothetical protein [Geobacter sp.]